MISIGITDHVESSRARPSAEVYEEVARQTILVDLLGFDYFWFSEHHAHAHFGHLPAPLLLALHLAGRTRHIRLGTAIVCLNLHHPLDVAEQVAVADMLSGERMAVGFGSGSTPEELGYFGGTECDETERHERFAEALRIIRAAWGGRIEQRACRFFNIPPHDPLPVAAPDLASRSWLAVNSLGAARIAGELGFNMMFSHLRTPEQYLAYRQAYHDTGGRGLVAANRPVYVGRDDVAALRDIEPALRILWRRFQREGKITANLSEPADTRDLCAHPINFIVGGPQSVAQQLRDLHDAVPYDVANLEPNWDGLPRAMIDDSLHRVAEEVRPLL